MPDYEILIEVDDDLPEGIDAAAIRAAVATTLSALAVDAAAVTVVLTTDEEDILLLSNLNTAQVVRTADMIGAAAVMIACGKPVPQDTLDLARELDISLICTEFPIFETCIHLVPLFNTVKK